MTPPAPEASIYSTQSSSVAASVLRTIPLTGIPTPAATVSLPRELLKWVGSLDLTFPVKNPRRALANGYLVAEILARYYPKDVPMHGMQTGTGMRVRASNWAVLEKVMDRRDIGGSALIKSAIADTMVEKPGAAEQILAAIYEHVNMRNLPSRQTAGTNAAGTIEQQQHGMGHDRLRAAAPTYKESVPLPLAAIGHKGDHIITTPAAAMLLSIDAIPQTRIAVWDLFTEVTCICDWETFDTRGGQSNLDTLLEGLDAKSIEFAIAFRTDSKPNVLHLMSFLWSAFQFPVESAVMQVGITLLSTLAPHLMAADPKCEILLHSLDPILPFAELVDLASKIPALAHILSSFIRASSEPHMVDLDVLHFFKKHLPVRLVPNFLAGLEVYPGDQGFWELEAQNCTTAISHYLEKLRSALPEHQQQLLLSSGETYGSGNGGGGGGAADGHKSSSQRSTVRSRGGGLSRSTTPTASLVTTTPFEALVAPPEISLLGSLAFFSSLACKAQIWSPATAAWWKASLPALEALEGGKFAAVGEDAALPRGTLALMLLDVLVGSLVAPPVTSAQPPRSNGARGSTVRVKAKVGGPDGWECLAIARSAEAVVGAAHAGSGVAAAPISTHIADTLLAIVTKLTAASRSFAYGGVVDHVVRRRYKPFEPSDSNANSPAKSAAALAVANDARTLHHAPAVVAFPALAATLARVTSRIPPDTLTQAVMGELPIHPIASLGALCAGPLGAALDSLPELREVFALGVAAAMASPSRIQMAGLTPLYPHLITFSAGASQAGRSLSGHGPATGAIYLRAVAADLLAAQPSLPAWTYFRALTHALPAPGTMGTGTVAAAESADAALLRHLAALVMATVAYHVTRPDAAGWVRQVARDLVYAERVRPSATFWHAVAAVVVSNWPAAVPETADLEELAGMESANTMEEF